MTGAAASHTNYFARFPHTSDECISDRLRHIVASSTANVHSMCKETGPNSKYGRESESDFMDKEEHRAVK
jgi:hypothetical protein